MEEIKDIDDPRIAFYKSLRYTPESHIKEKVFIAEGKRLVVRLLKSNLAIHSIFAINSFYEENWDLINAKNINEERLFVADLKLMEQIVGFHLHSGVMAIAYQPADCPLNEFSDVVVALNKVNNAENVGSIVRCCNAFGVDSLLVDSFSTSPFIRRAVRVSMGNVFSMKIHHTKNLLESLAFLKTQNYYAIAIELTNKSVPLWEFSIPNKSIFIFGNEGSGITDEILQFADNIVMIPISPRTESLNVALTCGIVLYEYNKQQNK